MSFDFVGNRDVWVSGVEKRETSSYRIVSSAVDGARWRIAFESVADGSTTSVYTLETRDDLLSLKKEEIDRGGVKTFRNEYKLRRVGAS